jgi:hypothetical protein
MAEYSNKRPSTQEIGAFMSNVSVRYLADFNGDNTIEFAGNQDGLMYFMKFLHKVSKHSFGSSFELDKDSHFKLEPDLKLKVVLFETLPGMFRNGAYFEWRITVRQIQEFCDLIKEVAEADFPCHQYLDIDESCDVVVIVSKGESSS